jgi:hypothetical protein
MVLMGILMNQFLYWRSWASEEKAWRKVTVVSCRPLDAGQKADSVVLGLSCRFGLYWIVSQVLSIP